MSLLTGDEIWKAVDDGRITINPFCPQNVGPNSYDVTLSDTLLVYRAGDLDMRRANPTDTVRIPPEGLLLKPGELYLASTNETVGSTHFVPCLEGRSSVGRLGCSVHATAGVGDRGFLGTFTLEVTVVRPLRVYAWVRIGQMLFFTVDDANAGIQYSGKYVGQTLPRASEMYRDREFQQWGAIRD